METMYLKISTLLIFLLTLASSAAALPICPGSPKSGNLEVVSSWTHCSGRLTFPSGNVYKGGWKAGKFSGNGKVYYKFPKENDGDFFEGEFKNGLRDGTRRHESKLHGTVTEGSFVKGSQEGFGSLTVIKDGPTKGQRYEGNFSNNYFHGYGKYTWPDGQSYEGNYVYGYMSGHGKLTNGDGSVYTGEFLKNLKHGKGRLDWPNGTYFVGQFVSDNMKEGIEYLLYGERYEGTYENNLRSGDGKYVYKDGSTFSGKYANGKRNGLGTYMGLDGSVSTLTYIDDEPDSLFTVDDKKKVNTIGDEIRNAGQYRVALVIGNSTYSGTFGSLKNPVNDAILVAKTLQELGFHVIKKTDANQKEIKHAVREFRSKLSNSLKKKAVGLFYYAGHGIQIEGKNYLIPTEAQITSEGDVDIEAISAQSILTAMESARANYNFIILDACRNNPIETSTRTLSRGLARMKTTMGSLIAYSTAPGSVALDGTGENSPYTLALVEAMKKDFPVEKMFRAIRTSVIAKTKNKQTPWETSSLIGEDFYFSRLQ